MYSNAFAAFHNSACIASSVTRNGRVRGTGPHRQSAPSSARAQSFQNHMSAVPLGRTAKNAEDKLEHDQYDDRDFEQLGPC